MTNIVHFSGFKSENVIILYLILYSARSRNVTYIAAHFLGLQSEIVWLFSVPYSILHAA